LNNASLFEAGNLLDSLPNGTPNNFDVLRATIKQIVLNYFFPTAIVVNPGDAAAMDIEKASDGHYILPPFSTPRGQTIKGVPVYENAGMAAGSFLVMDGSKATAYFREGISLRVWDQNENDPLFNRKTVTANVEALLRIKGVHTGAFVTGTFANAKLLLDASLSGSGS
jgi:HK97 family phage major capsid protein